MLADARIFDTRDFVPSPDMVVARHDQLSALSEEIDFFLEARSSTHCTVTGPTGAGKTMLSKYLLDELDAEAPDVQTTYCNCWDDHSEFGVVSALLAGVGDPVGVDERGTSLVQLRRRLREAVADHPLVVVLDEVVQLDDLGTLMSLYRMDNVFTLLICNEADGLFVRADEQATSRLHGGEHVHLDAYSVDELVSILEKRADHGLEAGVLADGLLEEIARHAGGDARVAIETLKSAAKAARAKDQDRITTDLVGGARDEAEQTVRKRSISKLKPTQRVLLDILQEAGEWTSMGEIHDAFCERDQEVTRQTLRRHLNTLDHYNHVEMRGEKRGRRYRAR